MGQRFLSSQGALESVNGDLHVKIEDGEFLVAGKVGAFALASRSA